MKVTWLLFLACACAAIAPVFSRDQPRTGNDSPRWPTHFQGRMLHELLMNERERSFLAGFPGAVSRFTDGERDIVMRWVTQPTRRLHPAEDCYRGLGFETSQSRIVSDGDRTQWRCFTARRGRDEHREVCEQLQDSEGRRWTDVSAWYWAAALKRSEGPWLVTTVTE
jgi:hypothetical protein